MPPESSRVSENKPSAPAPTAGGTRPVGTVIADAAQLACDRLIRVFGQSLQLAHAEANRSEPMRLPLIEFARAVLQMRIRPALSPKWPEADPVHVVMFGGTNSGKSTVINLLLGRPGAAMNPTARFSQHPVGFVSEPGDTGDVTGFLDHFPSRFRDYRRYIDQIPPRQDDAELRSKGYKPALGVMRLDQHHRATIIAPPASEKAVFWDAPDFSTEEARFYIRAVLDAVAMADVVVLCVTGESYANDLVAKLLRMVAGTGVSLHVAANKLNERLEPLADIVSKLRQGDGTESLELDEKQVHPLTIVMGDDVTSRLKALSATSHAKSLRDAMARDADRGAKLKRQILSSSVKFLGDHFEKIVKPLVDEVSVATHWSQLVREQAKLVISDRYQSDYIHGSRYGEFNQTLMKVLAQLDVPFVGQALRAARAVIRKPMQWAYDFVRGKLFSRKPVVPPEEDILGELIKNWFAKLRREVQTLASSSRNPIWFELDKKLADSETRTQVLDAFAAGYIEYRNQLDEEEKRRAAEMYDTIDKRPILKNTLRTGNLGLDALAVVLTVKSFGLDWSDAVLGPALMMVRQTIVDSIGEQFMSGQKTLLMNWQTTKVDEVIEKTLIGPVLTMLSTRVKQDELEMARKDFQTVRSAAIAVAGRTS